MPCVLAQQRRHAVQLRRYETRAAEKRLNAKPGIKAGSVGGVENDVSGFQTCILRIGKDASTVLECLSSKEARRWNSGRTG